MAKRIALRQMKARLLSISLKSAKLLCCLVLCGMIIFTGNLSATGLPRHSRTKQTDALPESEYQEEFHISPQDTGYLAIKSLMQSYNCMSLYADGHIGSRVELIRAEAVVDLNTCLDRAQSLITMRVIQLVPQSQMEKHKLQLQSLNETIRLLKRKNDVEN